ncbi:MAG: hypothetical protein LBM70_00610 [Victivallales bacterium]|jgi:hypothetical protein|nr:hypothetical protein [Victivallales bacterium]
MKKQTDAAWHFITDRLFCPETGLLYDYLGDFDHADRFCHLPAPEEIAASFPNPCGWSTGMEDCALNGGFLMDILRLRGELQSDFAAAALRGLLSLGTVHGKRGFIVRGISPADKKSCYGNSSRDQFTLAVFGLLTYWRNRHCDLLLRNEAVELLAAVADYCESIATPENNYNLRRLDGGRAVVSKLWECAPHEAFRLPMIFAAAAEATGEKKYFDLVRRFARPGIERTLKMNPYDETWWDMPLIQMQISLNTFRESRIMPELDSDVGEAMQLGAGIARRLLADSLDRASVRSESDGVLCRNWRLLPMYLPPATLGRTALFDGKSYLNPRFEDTYYHPLETMRGIGNLLGSIALTEEISPDDPLLCRADAVIGRFDFARCTHAGAIPLLHGRLLAASHSRTPEKFQYTEV